MFCFIWDQFFGNCSCTISCLSCFSLYCITGGIATTAILFLSASLRFCVSALNKAVSNSPFKYLKRRCITILEILIVILILTTITGVIGVSINKALVDQKFRTELSILVDELRLAQNLMLILGTDVHVKFKTLPENKGTEYWLETETELPKSIANEILKKHRHLKVMHVVNFFDENKTAKTVTENVVDVRFLSHGNVMSKGLMHLLTAKEDSSHSNILQAYIPLAGYPRPISSYFDKKLAEKEYKQEEDDRLDKALAYDTYSNVSEGSFFQPETVDPKSVKGTDK